MRRLPCLIGIAFILLVAPLVAQGPGGYGPGGAGGGMGGGRHGGGGGWGGRHSESDAPAVPTTGELMGPPAPATLHGMLSLSDSQVAEYRPVYEQHMQATQLQRDSVAAALTGFRNAADDRAREAMRMYFSTLRKLTPGLTDQDGKFEDKQLKPILTKSQAKAFDKWRDEQKKAADEERQQFRREHSGGRGEGMGAS